MRFKIARRMLCCTLIAVCVATIFRPVEVLAFNLHKGFRSTKIPAKIKNEMKGKSYHKNKSISFRNLRYLKVRYVDFQGNIKNGELIVNKKIAKNTLKVFYELYKVKYPIQRIKLIDQYNGNDEKSMADNNTSAFNYRRIANTTKLSNHALGMAIDINPRINPYIVGTTVAPANSRKYIQRNANKCSGKYAKYMIHRNDKCYRIMKKYGFSWGGDWSHAKDYQHFEA